MARPARPARSAAVDVPDRGDRAELERRIDSLQRENDRLRAELARGPRDETWFTPGVLGALVLGIFFALWFKYEPAMRRRAAAPAAEAAPVPGEYNPPAPPAAPSAPAAPGGH
ncbi:MAG: hypothetical protein U0324_06565 [Polyangiales bacterium]